MSEKELNDLIRRGGSANAEEAAADPAGTEDLKADNSRRRKMLIKFGVMGALAAIIMVFATI